VTRTVAFATLGCRLNQVDTREMQARLEARGFRTVPLETPADVVVVNSCTVTGRAEVSDRQAIRRAARRNPEGRVVVTGCWAQTDPEAAAATGADLVVGNADKHRIADLVESLIGEATRTPSPRVEVSDIATARQIPEAPLSRLPGRSRAFVKVQEGCQHRCAFCIVPVARGASRSQAPDAVLDQVRRLIDAGHVEVVLTGVDLGHYGADLVPRTSLAALLRRMIELRGLRWIRLSSVLPAYFTGELIEVVTGSAVIAPHLHVPLQSGSDRMLRGMRRPYDTRLYTRIVERLAGGIPSLGLGTDLIVGFPGETEEDFVATRATVEALPFSYLHVFAYSDRKGTEASRLPGRVDARVVARRSAILRGLAVERSLAFRGAMVGRAWDVLVLESRDRRTGGLTGLTGNYVEIVFDGPDSLMGTVARVRAVSAEPELTEGALA
jgi:threonylcarbamoyladenosine tRNA methylthiotransferase MtaB